MPEMLLGFFTDLARDLARSWRRLGANAARGSNKQGTLRYRVTFMTIPPFN